MLDRPWDERERYELLGRMEGNIPGYLSYSAEECVVACVFESTTEAEQFYTHKEQLRDFNDEQRSERRRSKAALSGCSTAFWLW